MTGHRVSAGPFTLELPPNGVAILYEADEGGNEHQLPGGVGYLDALVQFAGEVIRLQAMVDAMGEHNALQPIATAPRDGSWILGWARQDSAPYRISWGRNHNGKLAWCSAAGSFVSDYITDWLPLPAERYGADSVQCDACGEMKPRDEIANVTAYGIETNACDKCRGVEESE